MNITYFTQRESVLIIPGQECSTCKETRELLEELTETSDNLHLTVKDFVRDEQEAQGLGITRIPAFILQGHTRGAVRYFGIPAGYEFSTLVEDFIDVSKGTTKLSEKTRESLAMVDALPHGKSSFVRFKHLFSSDSAQVCPPRPQRCSSVLEREATCTR